MQGLVFGFEPGDIHRAGRSERSLRARGVAVEGEPVLDSDTLIRRLRDARQPLFLLRAGAWFVEKSRLETFPASGTGRMLLGLGAIRPRSEGNSHGFAELWQQWLRASGGDPQCKRGLLTKLADCWTARSFRAFGETFSIPEPFSCFLEPKTAGALASHLEMGNHFSAAIQDLAGEPAARVAHLSALDVHMDSARRVLQLVTTIQIGGAERVTLDLAQELDHQGVRVYVAALSAPTRTAFPRPSLYADLSHIPRDPAFRATAVAELAQDFGADLVHAHLIRTEEGRALKELGLPLVMTVHNSTDGWPIGLGDANGQDADLLLACAQSVARELLERGVKIPVRTVWNGIDPEGYLPTDESKRAGLEWRAEKGWGSEDFVLAAVANPRPQKRLHRLPEIVHELQAMLPGREVRLIIAGANTEGSGEAREAVARTEAEIARWKIEDRVCWTGGVQDVAPILAASDVLISVSAYEGLSLAHLEALAAGIPVVATQVGGVAEVAVQSDEIRLLPAEASAQEFAAVLAQLSARSDRPFPGLPASFHRRQMAARTRRLYPRVIERARGIPAGNTIWLITNNFSVGGAQSSARRLLTGLAGRGHAVRAFTVQEHPAHPTPGSAVLARAGIPVTAISPPENLDSADAAEQILEFAARERPRAVLFWNLITSYKIFLADGMTDVPIYDVSPGGMYHTSLDKYFAQPRPGMPYLSPQEYGARLAGVVIKYEAERILAARLGAPVKVIRNGVKLPAVVQRRTPDGQLVIGTAARISPDKRLEDLIEAFRLASPRLPKHVLRIAGGVELGAESYARELREQAGKLPVEWLGEVTDSQSFLNGLDLFAMISEPAGCPNASLEAMAARLPVIATNVGGASEQVIDGFNGRLVSAKDCAAFAEALVELGWSSELRAKMGESAATHVREHFTLNQMVENYERLCGYRPNLAPLHGYASASQGAG